MVNMTGFSGLSAVLFCPHPEKQVIRITKHNKIAILFIVPPSNTDFPTRIPTLLKNIFAVPTLFGLLG